MLRNLVGTLFTILVLMPLAGAAPAATLAGTVVALSGPCVAHGRALRRGDAVQVGDTVGVPAGANLELRMVDGSVILVAPGSSMTVASYSTGGAGRLAKLSLAYGLLRALVTRVAGPSTFAVSTAAGTASVSSASADWFIKAEADSAQVGVLAGTVDLTSAARGRSVSIPAHWGTRLDVGLAPMLPRVWSQGEFNAVIRLTECCQSAQPKIELPVR